MDALELVKTKLTYASGDFSEAYSERNDVTKSQADIDLRNFYIGSEIEESAWEAGYLAALIACVEMLENNS